MKTKKSQQARNKKIRNGDKVVAIAGNYRGMSGTVIACGPDRVVVQGLNVRKRHFPKSGQTPGKIVEKESPIHISNVRLCTEAEQPVKLRVGNDSEGQRYLYYKENGEEVTYRPIKKVHK